VHKKTNIKSRTNAQAAGFVYINTHIQPFQFNEFMFTTIK